MSELSTPPVVNPSPRRKSRWLRRLICALLALILLPSLALFGTHLYNRHRAERALSEANAETDQFDPGWRLEDIEKRRSQLPDSENAAIHIAAAAALIPADWARGDDLDRIEEEHPCARLNPIKSDALRKTVQPFMGVLPFVQKVGLLQKGRWAVRWAPSFIETVMDHHWELLKVCGLLRYLALMQCEDGAFDEAWQTTLQIINVQRAIGDEPTALSQLLRKRFHKEAIETLERCLGQGTNSDQLLAKACSQLTTEVDQPLFWFALQAERAGMNEFFINLEAGKLPQYDANRHPDFERAYFWLAGETHKGQHAWYLRHMNKLLLVSKMPPNKLLFELEHLHEAGCRGPSYANSLVWHFRTLAEKLIEGCVRLDCARTAIAVERFRLKNNRWPDTLDEVVAAKLLDRVPEDPYDGQPLRYRKTSDGVVVYSIGLNGNYAGDALDQGNRFNPNVFRYEFRLWDEAHRRQPPRPKKDEKDPGKY